MELLYKDVTDKILKSFYLVYNELQYGFKETIYEKAMLFELNEIGFVCERQRPIAVHYKGMILGQYTMDLVVENKGILELKTQPKLTEAHEAQLLHYLRATNIEIGMVLNFGLEPQFCRKVFTNNRKKLSAQ